MSAERDEKPDALVDPWTKYEKLKAQLPEWLSPEERESECRRIADELGI